MYRFFFKRLFDIVLSFLGIIVLAIPMLIIALAVKIDSKGPALFKTNRVGKNQKSFRFCKFRSMRTDAPKDCAPRLLHTDYTTKLGRFLRKTSLDELPQLFCILGGSMSIIGPRPAGLSETDLIEAREQYGANGVRPGLTGLAQINGRDVLAADVEKKAFYDGMYAKKITFWGDVKIFFKTIGKVFKKDGIVEGDAVMHQPTENGFSTAVAEAATADATLSNVEEREIVPQGDILGEQKHIIDGTPQEAYASDKEKQAEEVL